MGVEFDVDQESQKMMHTQSTEFGETSGIAAWLMRSGLARSAQGATRIMVVVFVLCVCITLYVVVKAAGPFGDTRSQAQILKETESLKKSHGPVLNRPR